MLFDRLTTAACAAALIAGFAAAPLTASAQTSTQTAAPAASAKVTPSGDLVQTLKASGQFTTFIKGLDATNLTGVLVKNPNLTVFAPTDAAFAALPPGEFDRLMADKPALQKLLTHHIINAKLGSEKFKGAKGPVTTVAGDKVELDGSGDALLADNATIIQPDVQAANGTIHVVDKVLMAGAAPTGTAAPASDTAPAAASSAP